MARTGHQPAARTSRPRRQSALQAWRAPDMNRLPGLMEEIQVLWLVNGASIWWRAEVTDIMQPSAATPTSATATTTTPENKRATTAVIRYVPRRGYVAEDYKVAFIHSVSGTKKLQHLSPCSPGFVTWKYPDEHVAVTPPQKLTRPSKLQLPKSSIAKKRHSSQHALSPTSPGDNRRESSPEVEVASSGAQDSTTDVGATEETDPTANAGNNRGPRFVQNSVSIQSQPM